MEEGAETSRVNNRKTITSASHSARMIGATIKPK